jgi:hypothetical protein
MPVEESLPFQRAEIQRGLDSEGPRQEELQLAGLMVFQAV